MIKSYVVRAGDHLERIAHHAGLDPDAIWNHPKNKALREKRPDRNQLREGDVVYLPIEEARPLPLQIGAENAFSATIPEIETHLRFGDENGPFANERYRVEGLRDPVHPIEGETDANGALVLLTDVTTRVARICFEKRNRTFTVMLGELDPIEEVSGVQMRLSALGYYKGTASGRWDAFTERALTNFQEAKKLTPTGKMDTETRCALKEAYGC